MCRVAARWVVWESLGCEAVLTVRGDRTHITCNLWCGKSIEQACGWMLRRSARTDEEDYFSREDEEEGDGPGESVLPLSNGAAAGTDGVLRDAPPRLLPLVDYDDDDDADDAGGALRMGSAKRGLASASGLAVKRSRLSDERPRSMPVVGSGGGLWRGRR